MRINTHGGRASSLSVSVCSNEDTDVKALVSMWLKNQPKEDQQRLEGWLEDFFYKGLDWVLKQNNSVVDTTLIGTTLNGLSHIKGVKTRAGFACALMRGLGGNLGFNSYPQLAKEASEVFVLFWDKFDKHGCLCLSRYFIGRTRWLQISVGLMTRTMMTGWGNFSLISQK